MRRKEARRGSQDPSWVGKRRLEEALRILLGG